MRAVGCGDIEPDSFHGVILVCPVRLQMVGYRTWLPSESRLASGVVHHIKCAIEDDSQTHKINQSVILDKVSAETVNLHFECCILLPAIS
jgi:hypothetical protein